MIESNLGVLYQAVHRFDESLLYLNRALIYFEQIKGLRKSIGDKIQPGKSVLFQKETTLKLYPGWMRLYQQLILPRTYRFLCLCLVTKADSLLHLNDIKMASAIINIAMGISSKINDRLSIAEVYKIKGKIELELNNLEYAENLLLTSMRLNKESENSYNLAETCF